MIITVTITVMMKTLTLAGSGWQDSPQVLGLLRLQRGDNNSGSFDGLISVCLTVTRLRGGEGEGANYLGGKSWDI